MQRPDEFGEYFNWLKHRAEERLLLQYGTPEAAEAAVRAKLHACQQLLNGTDVDIVFLVAGSIVANIVDGYGARR